MSFYFDVLFICCLHCIACCNSYTKGIKILIDIMTRKYNLKCEYDNTITEDEQALTLYRISLCFPSVTISACTAIQPSFSTSILSNFPNLPVELLNPYILYIMPLKCYGTPHELLICIKILLREYWSECEKLPLQTYNKIFDVACSNYVFPFKLKWKLLRKWKIVKKDGTFSYRFVDNVQMYNRDAKPLIRYLKERDSSLKERELSGQNDQKNSVNYQYIFSPFLQMYSG
ncbi:hypothetical protein X777_02411 [Ooceraea biroi]|uniref:Uncharacterized protein n=2 Tax=Ooceraea biroi TaxID=2015173 RepID=A0A026WN67_OOCBI|nr:hypothetical protein X777_02411 [Ooceraea biroi]